MAYATYKKLNHNAAIIDVSYANGGFGLERVERPRNGSLYETAFRAAEVKAAIQGERLERFSRE